MGRQGKRGWAEKGSQGKKKPMLYLPFVFCAVLSYLMKQQQQTHQSKRDALLAVPEKPSLLVFPVARTICLISIIYFLLL